jgi:GNAT superfamily N-acetyltransferase
MTGNGPRLRPPESRPSGRRALGVQPVAVADFRADRIVEGAQVTARAFQDDPLFRHGWPEDEERSATLPSVFHWNLTHGLRFGRILATLGRLDGLAIVFPPGEGDVFARHRLAESGYARMRESVGAASWDRLQASFDVADRALRAAVPEPCWYFDALAVDPPRQLRGLGSALVEAVHALADADGMPVALLTFQPRNVPFYARHGYEAVVSGADAAIGLSWWGFRRLPHGRLPTEPGGTTTSPG